LGKNIPWRYAIDVWEKEICFGFFCIGHTVLHDNHRHGNPPERAANLQPVCSDITSLEHCIFGCSCKSTQFDLKALLCIAFCILLYTWFLLQHLDMVDSILIPWAVISIW